MQWYLKIAATLITNGAAVVITGIMSDCTKRGKCWVKEGKHASGGQSKCFLCTVFQFYAISGNKKRRGMLPFTFKMALFASI